MSTAESTDQARTVRDNGHGWRAVAVVLAGAFMALLDTTIVTVALPGWAGWCWSRAARWSRPGSR